MSAPLLAAKLIELRQEHNLCQQDVADYLGMSREGYSHYERNTREPNLEILLRLCQFYKINISELVNTDLVPVSFVSNRKSASSAVKASTGSGSNSTDSVTPKLLKNMDHMLKLFSGKYTNIDVTDITKRDLDMLIWYKKLTKSDQKEIMEYIQFKYQKNNKKNL